MSDKLAKPQSRRKSQSGQALLLSLIVVMVIIMICGGLIYPHMAGETEYSSSGKVQGPASPIDDANDTSCTVYMSQVSEAATMYSNDHGHPPRDLEQLKPYGVTEEMIDTPNCNFGLLKYGMRQGGGYGGYSGGGGAPQYIPGTTTLEPGSAPPGGWRRQQGGGQDGGGDTDDSSGGGAAQTGGQAAPSYNGTVSAGGVSVPIPAGG